MPAIILISTIAITAALLFYTIGVWAEKFSGRLQPWHTVLFWVGLVCDTTGTTLMMDMAGGLQANLHSVTGVAAILLMLVHAVWATSVLLRRQEAALRSFHKFSVFVWAIWLVPFISGMLGAMIH